jgi:hypothetical protein
LTVGLKRPFKVTYHYHPSVERAQPVDGTESSHDLCKVREIARVVSRAGGTARVWTCDPTNGDDYTLRTYHPYQVALEDLIEGVVNDLMYGL